MVLVVWWLGSLACDGQVHWHPPERKNVWFGTLGKVFGLLLTFVEEEAGWAALCQDDAVSLSLLSLLVVVVSVVGS